MKHYDIIVIGSGAGAKISTPSSKLGYKVALLEKSRLGGTCLNRGCIPSKMLIHCADVANTLREAPRFQIVPGPLKVEFQVLVDRVCATIDEESLSINPAIEANPNMDWYRGHARFTGCKQLRVDDEDITGDRIFIAAGARPHIPNIPGLKDTPYLTSTEALRLNRFPQSITVIGGGYIAAELAHFYGSLGVEVHMFVRSGMVKGEDFEVREEFEKIVQQRFHVYMGRIPSAVRYQNEAFEVTYADDAGGEARLCTEQLLVATGVIPNSDQLDLEKTGVTVDKKGFIQVNDSLQTEAENIWAFGDIAGNFLFRHSANFEGEYLFETVIHQEPSYPIDYIGMPHAVFSHPQIAGVGEREDDLNARGLERNRDYVVGLNRYAQSAMGMALRSESGFVKLLIERETRKILGCHIIGDEASVLIHEVIPLMRLGGRLEDILYSIHIHPALSELVRNAARKARAALMEAGDKLPLRLQIK